MKKRSMIAIAVALVMSLSCLAGCAQGAGGTSQANAGGVLVLSVNPEIAITYDAEGIVTEVTARNDDATPIIASCQDLVGQQTRTAVTSLVNAIGEAGYFVEEVEGDARQITIEIEKGSSLPDEQFLDDVVDDVRECVNVNAWQVPLNVENESDYGISDYIDTDYGPDNDGATDFDDPSSNYDDGDSNFDANSNYDNQSNYDNNSNYDSQSNYDQTSNYDSQSNYDDSTSNYDSQSNYDDSTTNYDNGQSTYDDGTNYDSSDYDN